VDGVPQLFLMNGDGSRPQQITLVETDFAYTGQDSSWSPTG
jgi:Tol biopolymer transport system component